MNQQTPESDTAASPPDDGDATGAQASPRMLLRCAWGFAGVFLPFVCFAIGFPDRPSWQSGRLEAYAALLMSHEASLPLYPLLLFSMFCLASLTARPTERARRWWVWLGIFCGVVLSIEYWLLFVAALNDTSDGGGHPEHYIVALFLSAIAVAVPWFGCQLIVFVFRLLDRAKYNAVSATVLAVALGAAAIILIISLPYLAMLLLLCSTPWAVAAFLSAAFWLIRHRGKPYFRYTLAELLAATTALAANFAAWRTAYLIMLDNYSQLPTQAPQRCFVCSAAARGHVLLVRSASYRDADGRESAVNDQLRTLKAFELLMLALGPAAHRAARRVYDQIGPQLAATLVHPLAADAAYLALKPLEWFARLALWVVLGKRMALIARLYHV